MEEIDTSDIGLTASEMMEIIARNHPDATIEEVGIVVALRDPRGLTTIEARSSNPRQWIAEALFRRAAEIFKRP